MIYIPIIISFFAIVFVFFLIRKIKKAPSGSGKMIEISLLIREAARAFLRREYETMIPFFFLIAFGIGLINKNLLEALAFLIGAGISSLVSYIGMMVSTQANVRTTEAAKLSFPKGFEISFFGGAVMGFLVVSLGLLGISLFWFFFKDVNLLISFAFGSSISALFLRVGGGIYTKSADIGADLVGKLEKGIPEDDPRNPAVIADQVGDNVGDTAGMGSDLFESYVSAIIAAMIIGATAFGLKGIFLPLTLASGGVLSSIIGSFFIKLSPKIERKNFSEQVKEITKVMNKGIVAANILMVAISYFIILKFLGEIGIFYTLLIGLITGFLVGQISQYFTSPSKSPVLNIARSSQIGTSLVILEGLIVGIQSSILPVIIVALGTILAYHFGGFYGITIASVGILGVLGINLSTDCYGSIADNAAGISEMAGLGKEVRQKTEALDAVGNTTAAIGKGFAMTSATLAALAWLASYFEVAQLKVANLLDPGIVVGLLIGAMLSFLFVALTIKGVNRGALVVVKEVRRQFREIPDLIDGKGRADYRRCVDLITKNALKEMVLPGILIILIPILVGISLGKAALAGLLAGSLVTGFVLALMLANAGGAWDNAKKYIESGQLGGKGSEAHKAAIVGDTVGDPFKDTAGPSLNILIKLIGKVALIFLPLFG